MPYMGLHSCHSQDFWKSFNGSDKTKHVEKCGKICKKKKKKKKNLLGALPKIRDWIWKYVQIRLGF